jgi:hypothetical protein
VPEVDGVDTDDDNPLRGATENAGQLVGLDEVEVV